MRASDAAVHNCGWERCPRCGIPVPFEFGNFKAKCPNPRCGHEFFIPSAVDGLFLSGSGFSLEPRMRTKLVVRGRDGLRGFIRMVVGAWRQGKRFVVRFDEGGELVFESDEAQRGEAA